MNGNLGAAVICLLALLAIVCFVKWYLSGEERESRPDPHEGRHRRRDGDKAEADAQAWVEDIRRAPGQSWAEETGHPEILHHKWQPVAELDLLERVRAALIALPAAGSFDTEPVAEPVDAVTAPVPWAVEKVWKMPVADLVAQMDREAFGANDDTGGFAAVTIAQLRREEAAA